MIRGLSDSAGALLRQQERLAAAARDVASAPAGTAADALLQARLTQVLAAQRARAQARAVQTLDELLGTLIDLRA